MKKIIHVVPHSHWDREWYFTLEDSQVLLGENLSQLIEFLESTPEFPSYTFDGQISIIEEFIKYYPQYEVRLKKLIREKRILVGPWYTQSDTLLVGTESIIRNLYYGISIAKQFGHSMDIGYLPDVFGQNSYLPSIFKDFGIGSIIAQRGFLNKQLDKGLNLKWESPNGNSLWTNNLYLGYGPGKFLSSEPNYVTNTLLPMITKLDSFNPNQKNLLLPAGGDQVLVRKYFPETIKAINLQLKDYELVMSSYEQFITASKTETHPMNTIKGELRATQKSRIHRTIGSQRYDIKYSNQLWEHRMLNILEPLNVLSSSVGLAPVPQTWIDDLWKTSFDVHSHDSIGGCNSDDTNTNIMSRLTRMHHITDNWINILQKRFAYCLQKDDENIVTVWNLDVHPYQGWVEMTIFSTDDFILMDQENTIPFQIILKDYIGGGKKIVVTAEKEQEVEIPGYYQYKVLVDVSLKALSHKSLVIMLSSQTISSYQEQKDPMIENEYYRFSVEESQLIFNDKNTNKEYHNPLFFEYTQDAGDSYDYAPTTNPELTSILTDASVLKGEASQVLRLTHTLTVPISLDSYEEQTITIITEIEFRKGQRVFLVNHKINNTVKDWRLRAIWTMFGSDIINTSSAQGFSFIQHPIQDPNLANWKENSFVEAPVSIYNFEGIFSVFDESTRFNYYSIGLKEYEVINKNQLALTLFRSVGLLGRDNLPWRPGRASGINNKQVLTPDTYLLQDMEFFYGIMLSDPILDTETYIYAKEFMPKITSYQYQSLNTFLHRLDRFELPMEKIEISTNSILTLDSSEILCSMLHKKNESICIRLFNPSSDIITTAVVVSIPHKKIVYTNLLGEELENIHTLVINPRSYCSLKIIL